MAGSTFQTLLMAAPSSVPDYEMTISTNQLKLDLHAYAITDGWNETDRLVVTINSGVYIWSDDTATAALDMGGTFSGGCEINLNGYIMGMGGTGGGFDGSYNLINPAAGGPAFNATDEVTIIGGTSAYIGGGGGGGGSAIKVTLFSELYAGGGGAGGGAGGRAHDKIGGTGGAVGASGNDGSANTSPTTTKGRGGSGGGGGGSQT